MASHSSTSRKELAIETIESLGEDDYLRVLVSANSQRWLTEDPLAMGKEQRNSLIAEINSLKPTSGDTDFPLAIQEALALPPAEEGLPRQISIFADGTAHGWQADDATVWTSSARFIREASTPHSRRVRTRWKVPSQGRKHPCRRHRDRARDRRTRHAHDGSRHHPELLRLHQRFTHR